MASSKKRKRVARARVGGIRQAGGGEDGLQAKPGARRARTPKGGRDSTKRAKHARSGAAKKASSARKGTDRSRHRVGGKKKTRAMSLSPSQG